MPVAATMPITMSSPAAALLAPCSSSSISTSGHCRFKLSIVQRNAPNLEALFTVASHAKANFRQVNKKMKGPCAVLGGGGGDDSKEGVKKKFITKEQEPEQYWQTAAERDGVNPMKTPLPYIIIFGFLTPFIILGVAFANGWIKVPVR